MVDLPIMVQIDDSIQSFDISSFRELDAFEVYTGDEAWERGGVWDST